MFSRVCLALLSGGRWLDHQGPGFRVLAAFGALLAFASVAQGEKVLRWKLQPGQRLQVQMTQQIKQTATLPGGAKTTKIDLLMELAWTVDSVEEDGSASITQSLSRIKVVRESAKSEKLEYDSASKEKPTGLAKVLADSVLPLVDATFSLTLSNRGEILNILVNREAAEAIQSGPGAELISQESLKQLFGRASPVFPEEGVSKGSVWSQEQRVRMFLSNISLNTNYTYQGEVEQNGKMLDQIDLEMTMSILPGGADITHVIEKQQNRGTVYFDADAGRLVETDVHNTLTLKTTLGQATVTSQMDSTVKMTVRSAQ